ncbi:hypothetical protein THAOC_22036, partial [Thalassiosira oceanica]
PYSPPRGPPPRRPPRPAPAGKTVASPRGAQPVQRRGGREAGLRGHRPPHARGGRRGARRSGDGAGGAREGEDGAQEQGRGGGGSVLGGEERVGGEGSADDRRRARRRHRVRRSGRHGGGRDPLRDSPGCSGPSRLRVGAFEAEVRHRPVRDVQRPGQEPLALGGGDGYGVVESAFRICRGRTSALDVAEYDVLGTGDGGGENSASPAREPVRSYLSFLSYSWGLIADCDVESEALRFLGPVRSDVWAVYRGLLCRRRYRARFAYLPPGAAAGGSGGTTRRTTCTPAPRPGWTTGCSTCWSSGEKNVHAVFENPSRDECPVPPSRDVLTVSETFHPPSRTANQGELLEVEAPHDAPEPRVRRPRRLRRVRGGRLRGVHARAAHGHEPQRPRRRASGGRAGEGASPTRGGAVLRGGGGGGAVRRDLNNKMPFVLIVGWNSLITGGS